MYFEHTASSRDSRPSLSVCTNISHLFSLKNKDSRRVNAVTVSDFKEAINQSVSLMRYFPYYL